MSLASDILRAADRTISPPQARKRNASYIELAHRPTPRKKKAARERVEPVTERRPTPPGVCGYITAWRRADGTIIEREVYHAYGSLRGIKVNLGEFATPERAYLAARLYRLWQRHGFDDVPHKPTKRLYVRRQIAD